MCGGSWRPTVLANFIVHDTLKRTEVDEVVSNDAIVSLARLVVSRERTVVLRNDADIKATASWASGTCGGARAVSDVLRCFNDMRIGSVMACMNRMRGMQATCGRMYVDWVMRTCVELRIASGCGAWSHRACRRALTELCGAADSLTRETMVSMVILWLQGSHNKDRVRMIVQVHAIMAAGSAHTHQHE